MNTWKTERWVLAFDASCARCEEISAAVERAGDHKLEVLPLTHSDVERWRAQALGADPAWVPTLIRVRGGGRARAWTGPAMGARLVRRLGPAATVRLLRALGELRQPTAAEPGHRAAAPSRKSFLRLGAGLGVAAGLVLTGNSVALADELTRARAWVRANQDRLPQQYDEVVAHSIAYRRTIFEELPAEVRSRLWVEHLKRYRAEHPEITAEQAEVLDRATAIAGKVQLFQSGKSLALEEETLAVREAAIATFGRDQARRILATLGPAGTEVVRPQVRDCECNHDKDWCPGFNCQTCSWNCCEKSSWGCGDYYAYPCDGLCR